MKNVDQKMSLCAMAVQMGRAACWRAAQYGRPTINCRIWVPVLAIFLSMTGVSAEASVANCVIASNDGRNGFRTDEVSGCRVDTGNGQATFVFNGKNRQRSYTSFEPLTTRHLEAASYWLSRAGSIRVPANTNPAGFDLQSFLSAASQATHGFVLTRTKSKGGRALNVVFITNGVYRSIDFPGTNLREMPSGFLMTK